MRPNTRIPGIHSATGPHRRLSQNQYAALVIILLGGAIFLSATDFITTSTAIGMGLQEGNYALITLSQSLGIGLLTTLGLTKAFFAFGCCAASYVGIRMRGNATGWLAVSVLAGFVLIQLAVSVNNFSIIIG